MYTVALAISPTLLNVCTDLVLLLMQFVWLRLLDELSKLNVKKNIRLGHRVFTYDGFGSIAGILTGWKRSKQLKQLKQRRDNGECDQETTIRAFQFQPIIVVLTTLLGGSIVILHVLIDIGLDFTEAYSLQSKYTSVEMIGLRSNPQIMDKMEQFRTFDIRKAGCNPAKTECLREVERVHEYLGSTVLESFGFVKSLLQASSITELDVLERLETEYVGGDKGVEAIPKNNECRVEEKTDMSVYYGDLPFAQSTCVLRFQHVRAVEIDMRARKALSTSVYVDTSGFGKEFGLQNRSRIDYFTYKRLKMDQTYEATTFSLNRLEDAPGERDLWKHVAELDVRASMRYRLGSKQSIKITDLTRSKFGEYTDTEWEHPLQTTVVTGQRGDGETPCLLPNNVREGYGRQEIHLTIALGDVTCSYTGIVGVLHNCNIKSYPVGDKNVTFAFQNAEAGILIDPEDECGKLAKELYAPYYEEDNSSVEGLFLGIRTEIVCTGGTRLYCAWGAGKENQLFYGDDGFTLNRDIEGDFVRLERQVFTELSWLMLQISGGDRTDMEKVIDIVGEGVKTRVDIMRMYTNQRSIPSLIYGAHTHFTIRDILSGLSTQIVPVNRDVLILHKHDMAEINSLYIGGCAAVVLLMLLLGLTVLVRFIQERRAYHRLGIYFLAPASASNWIQAALSGSQRPFRDQEGDVLADYEFVAYPKSGRDSDSSDVPIGYFALADNKSQRCSEFLKIVKKVEEEALDELSTHSHSTQSQSTKD